MVPEEDDWEVTFLRGGRVPTGPQPLPTSPAPAGPDMGQLISTLTLGLQIGTPKISTFSGKAAPFKTEVSYEQWSHEVQCIKDHYLESVVHESIMQSLKGAAADMARYMGPTAGVSNILEKLSVIFGTVTSFDVLMQNFYKISQGNEKVPSIATRLEGTLNQIQIKCPGRIADHEVPSHLKDWLFHGVKNTSETPCDISIVTHGPPIPSWWSWQEGLRVKWRRPRSRCGQLQLQRCPQAQKS